MIAELRGARLDYATVRQLQWGRDQLIAELLQMNSICTAHLHASMGPRSIDRGTRRCGFHA